MHTKLKLIVMALLCVTTSAFAQTTNGTVVDNAGNPIIGATVTVEGSNVSTTTDMDGKYWIAAPQGAQVTISYIGYQPQTVKPGGTTRLSMSEEDEETEKATLSDQAFTFTETQLGEDDDMAQSVSIISSNQNVFANSAGYQFSAGRYRYRAFTQKYNEVYINGAPMNDLVSGQFRYAVIGGLNRQTNSGRENALPFEFNNFSMSAMAGSVNYDFRPSRMATGQYASLAGANRSYQLRGIYTYNTGLRPDGWAMSAGLTYRWAHRGYAKGTFYNSLSYFFGAEKKLNDQHSIALVTWGSPTERASQGAATDEVYWLANDNYYNPYWGYQEGKVRSSRIVHDFAPTALLNWDWTINENMKLATAFIGNYSIYKGTSLGYNGGENPTPDYWKRMPSAFYNVWFDHNLNTEEGYNDYYKARDLWMSSEEYRQLDWDRLYYTNRMGNKSGRDAQYYLSAKHTNTLNLTLASTLKTQLSKTTALNIGFSLGTTKSMNYKTMDDLLGANIYHNVNSYAMGTYAPDDIRVQYDLNNPNAVVKEGDKMDYDYNLLVNKAQVWTALKYQKNMLAAFVAGRVAGTTMQRDGKMRNGIAESMGVSSYGKSEKARFLDGGAKAGLTYNFGGGHVVTMGAGFELKTPQPKTAFVSPEMTNEFVANLKNEKIFSAELGYQFATNWMKANLNGYYSRLTDVTEWQNFFDDDISSFSYVSMTGIKKAYYGVELGMKFTLTSEFSLKLLGSISEAKNTNNATVRYMSSSKPIEGDNFYAEETVLNKNMRESGTPLSVYGATLSYNSHGWFIDLNANYYDRIYLGYSPAYRYESTLKNRNKAALSTGIVEERTIDDDGNVIQSALDQTKGKGGFMLDLNIGRSYRLKKGQLSINLMISNLLNNTSIVTGGYEQSRSNYSINSSDGGVNTKRLYRFDKNPKKYYAWGINGMLNIGYRF